MRKSLRALWVVLLSLLWMSGWPANLQLEARPPKPLQAATNKVTYNAGEAVELRLIPPSPEALRSLDSYLFTLRFAGDEKPVVKRVTLGEDDGVGYRLLWKVPRDARTGRYEIDLRVEDPASHQVIEDIPRISSFVVHRQVVRIISADVARRNYTSGDAIGCNVKMENLTDHPLTGLRLEFSERYWPWIVQQTKKVGADIETLEDDMTLNPNQPPWEVGSSRCAVAKKTKEPAIAQYAAVVWDHDRKNVYAIAISPLVFINPPGVETPRPYPGQYLYPKLDAVNTTNYRQIHPEPFGAGAIQFDTHQTMFPTGGDAAVRFSLVNPTDTAWRQVTVRARLVGPDKKEVANNVVAQQLDLAAHSPSLAEEVKFPLPEASGLYLVSVEITAASGEMLATNTLELGVNPLPRSVLVFCAHEDDDGTQMGFMRALVENHVPLHVIYFTSGDAGSCDRYFEHSCGPAEALDFGAIRMDEARAALGHLGVPGENVLFLGLPDGGSGKIWYDHVPPSDPYLSIQLASDHAPYEGLFRPNLPFARERVVAAAADIIKQFQPDVVFTVHPREEGHIDHIVNNYFVVKALEQLLREGAISPNLELRVDRIFDAKGYPATPYHYEEHVFHVSGEVMALAQEAGWYYQSQGGNRGKGNPRLWEKLPRSEGYRKVLDWKEHEGWNEKER
jgi:LmbE family N-acetylglucosaminyl deacetylase